MRFDQWLAETARVAAGWHGIDLDQVARPYLRRQLWAWFVAGVPSWEAAGLAKNVFAPGAVRRDSESRAPRN
jgi:hypothetical protein